MDLVTNTRKFKELEPQKANEYAKRFKIKADELEYVQKDVVASMDKVNEEERAVIKYVSTVSIDRDNEILLPDGAILDDFKKNPVVLFGHDYRGLPIGKDMWIKADGKGLIAKQQYANHQLADDVFNLHKDGFALASSVGFIPLSWVNNDEGDQWKEMSKYVVDKYGLKKKEVNSASRIYDKWLLLEHSDVPVPSNPDALSLALEDGSFVVKAPELLKELENEPTEAELKVAELETTIEELKEQREKLADAYSKGNDIRNEKILELEHTILEKDAEIEDLEAKLEEKTGLTKEEAINIVKENFNGLSDDIKRLMGKV